MSKMREALREAMGFAWREGYACRVSRINQENWSCEPALSEIAQRYGDLEFTRDEVRGMLWAMFNWLEPRELVDIPSKNVNKKIDEILSRHTGAKPMNPCSKCGQEQEWLAGRPAHPSNLYCPTCDTESISDETPTIKASEIEDLSKRIATLEKALLARGHAVDCILDRKQFETAYHKCTCHYDEVGK